MAIGQILGDVENYISYFLDKRHPVVPSNPEPKSSMQEGSSFSVVKQAGASQREASSRFPLHARLFSPPILLLGLLAGCPKPGVEKPPSLSKGGDPSVVEEGAVYYSDKSVHYGVLSEGQRYRDLDLPKGSKIYVVAGADFFYVDLSQDANIHGVSFPSGSRVYLGQEKAHLAKANLSRGANIQGVSFPAGAQVYFGPDNKLVMAETQGLFEYKNLVFTPQQRLIFHNNGQLHVGRVARALKPKSGLVIPAGSRVEFDREGNLATAVPSETVEVDGKAFPANMSQFSLHPTDDRFTAIIFAPGRVGDVDAPAGTGFYFQNGAIRSVVMLDNGQLARIGDGSYEGTVFIHRGQVLMGKRRGVEGDYFAPEAVLSRSLEYQDVKFPEGSKVYMVGSDFSYVDLSQEANIHGVSFPSGSRVYLGQEKAHLAKANLASAANIQGVSFPAGAQVYFGPDNKLVMAETPRAWKYKAFSFTPQQRLIFHSNGQLQLGRVATELQPKSGLTIPAGSRVEFDREGNLATAVPSETVEVDGKAFPANMSQINLHPTEDRFTAIIFAPGRVGDVDAPAGTGFYFQNGAIRSVVMLDDYQPARIGAQSYQGTIFIHRSQVLLGKNAGRGPIDGLDLPQGTEVVFDAGGHLVDATLSDNATVADTQYRSGTTLFIENGMVVGNSR